MVRRRHRGSEQVSGGGGGQKFPGDICRYFLYAPNVDATDNLDEVTAKTAAGKYDFIVILDPEAVNGVAAKMYGGMFNTPGIYPADGISGIQK